MMNRKIRTIKNREEWSTRRAERLPNFKEEMKMTSLSRILSQRLLLSPKRKRKSTDSHQKMKMNDFIRLSKILSLLESQHHNVELPLCIPTLYELFFRHVQLKSRNFKSYGYIGFSCKKKEPEVLIWDLYLLFIS